MKLNFFKRMFVENLILKLQAKRKKDGSLEISSTNYSNMQNL
ncbi:hypothetical protein QFZ37_002990 [Chryseobacterium ginsenosidimutans]|nr:hypothetical protein [Chryseobacterium ginsenosidimutans]